jgi:hypothetical protein
MPTAAGSKMLKKSASFVLAALRGSTYRKTYRLAASLAAAALDSLFERPATYSDATRDGVSPGVQQGFQQPGSGAMTA